MPAAETLITADHADRLRSNPLIGAGRSDRPAASPPAQSDEGSDEAKPPGQRLSIARKAGLGLLGFYKVVLSPLFPGCCRYLPSCSEYAREAVATYGLLHGSWLALRRLSRCHPFGSSGLDPVPDRVPRV
jgi:putative membrane protein insertion efficiency factor